MNTKFLSKNVFVFKDLVEKRGFFERKKVKLKFKKAFSEINLKYHSRIFESSNQSVLSQHFILNWTLVLFSYFKIKLVYLTENNKYFTQYNTSNNYLDKKCVTSKIGTQKFTPNDKFRCLIWNLL